MAPNVQLIPQLNNRCTRRYKNLGLTNQINVSIMIIAMIQSKLYKGPENQQTRTTLLNVLYQSEVSTGCDVL